MIKLSTTVDVFGVSAKQVFDFMINCSDEKYREWWPEMHFQFHTLERFPGDVGNIVYFDELIGSRRVKFKAVVIKVKKNQRIVWQLKWGFLVPVYVDLKLEEEGKKLQLTHLLKVGFNGAGKVLDPFFRLALNRKFEKELDSHASQEFGLLVKMLLVGTSKQEASPRRELLPEKF